VIADICHYDYRTETVYNTVELWIFFLCWEWKL